MGLAVGDDQTGVVSPLEVVPYDTRKAAAGRISEAALRTGAGRVVIGLPTLEDGSVGPAGRRSRALGEAVRELGIAVVFQGEFLTTDEAKRRARSIGRPPRAPVDDLAAQVILEEYLAGRSRAAEG